MRYAALTEQNKKLVEQRTKDVEKIKSLEESMLNTANQLCYLTVVNTKLQKNVAILEDDSSYLLNLLNKKNKEVSKENSP